MFGFLPQAVRDELAAARRTNPNRRSRLRVHSGEAVFPILHLWSDGFAIDADRTAHLRGLVDIYDGARYLSQCLIVASAIRDGELVCGFKRATPVSDRPALDYCRDETAPGGYLPRF